MGTRPGRTRRVARHTTMIVSLLVLPALVSEAAAQTGGAGSDYTLTMPTLRKLLPALHVADAGARCEALEGGDGRDAFSMSVAELTTAFESCGPVTRALRQAGLTTSEAATAFSSMLEAMMWRARHADASGQEPAPPEGVLGKNVELLRQNEAEIEELSRGSGSS